MQGFTLIFLKLDLKTHNYLSIFSFNNFFLKFLNINVLYLTNTFLTNIPSFYLLKKTIISTYY